MTAPELTDNEVRALLDGATPGPWQVEGVRHSGDLKIGAGTRLHMVGPDCDAVAAAFFDMQTGRGLADARLIAAAPDLARAALSARAERDILRAELADWQKSQHYTYIGRDGKPVLARDIEDRAEAAEAELARVKEALQQIARLANSIIEEGSE